MVSSEVAVQNSVGLHARPATFSFKEQMNLSQAYGLKDERRVNAKSLLGVLSLGIVKGTSISIIADGSDEEEAVKTLVELIESNFSE